MKEMARESRPQENSVSQKAERVEPVRRRQKEIRNNAIQAYYTTYKNKILNKRNSLENQTVCFSGLAVSFLNSSYNLARDIPETSHADLTSPSQ